MCQTCHFLHNVMTRSFGTQQFREKWVSSGQVRIHKSLVHIHLYHMLWEANYLIGSAKKITRKNSLSSSWVDQFTNRLEYPAFPNVSVIFCNCNLLPNLYPIPKDIGNGLLLNFSWTNILDQILNWKEFAWNLSKQPLQVSLTTW